MILLLVQNLPGLTVSLDSRPVSTDDECESVDAASAKEDRVRPGVFPVKPTDDLYEDVKWYVLTDEGDEVGSCGVVFDRT